MLGIKNSTHGPVRMIRALAARLRPAFAARRRATVLLMVVGMLAMLFVIITAYLTLARFERLTLQQVDSRREARRVVDALNDLLRSYIREEITNSSGDVLGNFDSAKPYNFENTPGFGASRYLASLEPVYEPTGIDAGNPRYGGLVSNSTYGGLTHFRFPAVTTLGETSANLNTSPYIAQLMWDFDQDGSIDPDDLGGNSRTPFLDADGDGVPDADFLGMRLGIEIANALAGRSVRVPDSNYFPPQFQAGPNNETVALWREYERTRKYDVAARVVSHGGMLALDAVGDAGSAANGYANVWNRRFVAGMFLQLKADTGTNLGQLDPGATNSTGIYDEIASNATAIEPLLRRRFLLPTWRPTGSNIPLTVPEALETLEVTWPRTFAPTLASPQGAQRQESWQRFSFVRGGSTPGAATGRDWQAYAAAVYKEPQYNSANSSTAVYDVRHLLTTTSNSDDLIRLGKAAASDPNVDLKLPLGTTKFDLGLINRAFRVDGSYNVDPLSTGNPINGPAIVRRLAMYYYEMLRDYRGFPDTGTGASGDDARRREQAWMIAVNTVAEAAPRIKRLGGYTDVVYATDSPPSGTPVTYVGYAPQPFITQVIAYNEPGANTSSYQVALGVEIYNPNDPTDIANDEHALPMSQYFISINDDYESGVPQSLAAILEDRVRFERPQPDNFLAGRSFAAFAVQTGNNSHFDPIGGGNSIRVPRIMEGASTPMDLRVKLWRKSSNGAPFKIDEFTVDIPGGWTADVERYIDAYRDCTAETTDLYGDYAGSAVARWRVVSANVTDVDVRSQAPGLTDLGLPLPSTVQAAPFVPLYVMNRSRDDGDTGAQYPGYRTIHGTRRPTAFPTPGFLLFTPRYSHIGTVDTASGLPLGSNKTLSQVVESAWSDPAAGLSLGNYPADFGHMPVFDNRGQTAIVDSHFDDKFAGRVPWGLLVFDYFTTLNVEDPNRDGDSSDRLDPLSLPSRININTAPWTMLAELPVLSANVLSSLDLNMSPAFRDVNAGVLIGQGSDGEPRFLAPQWLANSDSTQFSDVLRLGTHLAVAAASYRDRVQYAGDTDGVLPSYSSYRDHNSPALYRPYVNIYGAIRAGNTAAPRTGFVSVGELMNVRGFDFNFRNLGSGQATPRMLGTETLRNNGGDYFRAIALLAMLDTQFLTTRSNTFTMYLTIADRANPQASIRSQLTVDRSNILPRIVQVDDGTLTGTRDGFPDFVTTITSNALPQIVGQREIGYANARYDD